MKPDVYDVMFFAGVLAVAGSLGWLVHPAVAVLAVGVACIAVGLWGALKA